ncbi:hypothetical protein I7I51_02139 [Histoplasma capsulatum]|uniref:Uncharacterized protein n=1 Tax=Ajellomyces capsulatus TaxID=5037 RepID=A0A8A1MD19_AJECA|nr:predicted protein [Histoplasma mississippiense (nom. inval.)]EDN04199.1 predicted protein [Histoplasma mississippiense (nom. inval.)]QSS62402.1 hypothetical protein I7I51_02139 [Histoplasma capsulatum]
MAPAKGPNRPGSPAPSIAWFNLEGSPRGLKEPHAACEALG